MDKGRDVRRAQSRFSPAKRQIKQSVHKLLSGKQMTNYWTLPHFWSIDARDKHTKHYPLLSFSVYSHLLCDEEFADKVSSSLSPFLGCFFISAFSFFFFLKVFHFHRHLKWFVGLDGCEGRGGDAVFPEKPKKERVKKLSVVGRANSVNEDVEMGCSGTYGSEEEEEQQLRSQAPSPGSSKRFKLPKKVGYYISGWFFLSFFSFSF